MKDVGVMKDEELHLEEIEASHIHSSACDVIGGAFVYYLAFDVLASCFLFIIRGKARAKDNTYTWVSV